MFKHKLIERVTLALRLWVNYLNFINLSTEHANLFEEILHSLEHLMFHNLMVHDFYKKFICTHAKPLSQTLLLHSITAVLN